MNNATKPFWRHSQPSDNRLLLAQLLLRKALENYVPIPEQSLDNV